MSYKTNNYNLLVEQWIPVLWTDGKPGRVGISEALTQAGRIRQIAATNPMDRVAILRFLLALLYWCTGNPPTDEATTPGDSFPCDWLSKLDENQDRFNLLGDRKRFYQYHKSGPSKDERLSANYLVQEVPTGTNKWHFRHSTDRVDGLCPACCAMGLLRLPLFATSGGRGKPPGVNSKPPIYVMPLGVSLADTLRLSWVQAQVANLGTPAWEEPGLQLPKAGEVPLLMGLTWLPRRVWLDDPQEPEGNCISCGRRERLIRLSVFAPIGSMKTPEGSQGRIWRDPHVIYERSSRDSERKGVTSLHANSVLDASDAAGQWTKIIAAMISEQEVFAGRSAWVVGFATVQNDKYLEAREQVFPIPSASPQSQETIHQLDRWHKEGWSLVRRLRPPDEKKSSRKHVEIRPMVDAIRPHVEGRVSAMVGELVAGGHDAWVGAAEEYGPMMAVIAKSLSPGFTTAAVRWRRQIAAAAPDMRPETRTAEKPDWKEGADK